MPAVALPDAPEITEEQQLHEAVRVAAAEGFKFGPDKTVPIHIIRPGIGRGKGRHVYEANMLAENAENFAGWKMYVDHRSKEAQRAAGGLPRGVRELGGRVLEATWDPTVPADEEKGFGPGAVVGQVRPVKWLREMIEDDPELIETSISATATGVKRVKRGGTDAWLVEGIGKKGSVDWVTEAGAGGKVAPKLEEAFATDDDVELALLEAMTDDEIVAHITAERPNLRLVETPVEDDGVTGEPTPTSGEPTGAGAAQGHDPERTEESADSPPPPIDPEEGDMAITPELLREALQTDDGRGVIRDLVEAELTEERTKFADEREVIRAEARAEAQREVTLQKLEVRAAAQINEADIPDAWKEQLNEQYRLAEGGDPTPSLDVVDEIDGDGSVVKSAYDVLKESLADEIKRLEDNYAGVLAEAAPTRVRGQGRTTTGEREKRKPSETNWGKFLQETAKVNPDRAFAGSLALQESGSGDDDK